MITVEDVRMAIVRADLRFMDEHAPKESPIVLSIAKAVTSAQLHPDIEARIVCRDRDEAIAVTVTLAKMALNIGRCFVDSERRTLEFTNGSAVRVVYEPKGKRP